MSTPFATETKRLSNVVKHELWPETGYCRKVVTINDAATTLAIGAVLGKVTATGKYKVADKDATDGSEVAAAIVIEDKTIAATTDTPILVLIKGPAEVGNLVYGDTVSATVNAQLEAVGINVLTAA